MSESRATTNGDPSRRHDSLTPLESALLRALVWNCDGIDGHSESAYHFIHLWSERVEGMSPDGFLEAMDRALERLLAKELVALDEGGDSLASYSAVFEWSKLDAKFRGVVPGQDVQLAATEAGKAWCIQDAKESGAPRTPEAQ